MNYYILTDDGRRIGPVTTEELITLGLTHESLVWRQNFNDWLPASQVPELTTILNSIPPCPPKPRTKPDNNLVLAIISTILCCLPLGIVSIVYASKVDSLWNAGKYTEAEAASKKANNWALSAFCCSFLIMILYIIILANSPVSH